MAHPLINAESLEHISMALVAMTHLLRMLKAAKDLSSDGTEVEVTIAQQPRRFRIRVRRRG